MDKNKLNHKKLIEIERQNKQQLDKPWQFWFASTTCKYQTWAASRVSNFYRAVKTKPSIELKTDQKSYPEIISKWIKDSSESKQMCSYQASTQTTDWKKLVILSRMSTLRVKVSDFYRALRIVDLNQTQHYLQNCYSVVTLKWMIINSKLKEVQPRDKSIDLNKPTDLQM